jgi:hypothetical protein
MTYDQSSSVQQQQQQQQSAYMDDSFAVQNDFVKLEDDAESTVAAKNSSYHVTLNEQSSESNMLLDNYMDHMDLTQSQQEFKFTTTKALDQKQRSSENA